MTQTQLAPQTYTIDEWLALEAETGEKYEYHNGELFSVSAMSGGTYAHALLGSNASRTVGNALESKGLDECNALNSDLQVKINLQNQKRYVYPDAAVVCGEPEFDKRSKNAVLNPTIILEVLSPSSADYDRGLKFNLYKLAPTLRDYVLISQDAYEVEIRSRSSAEAAWVIEYVAGIDEVITLPSLGLVISLKGLYRGLKIVEPKRLPKG